MVTEATDKKTPLYQHHVDQGARMVSFAGYAMPVQYDGIVGEHIHCRENAGLFDVSHMGQAFLDGPNHETVAAALETLVPADVLGLAPGQQRYSQLLTDSGGILDDLMITRSTKDGRLILVVNAARKEIDFAYLTQHLPSDVTLRERPEQALIAIQGPKAEAVLAHHIPAAKSMAFMTTIEHENLGISRSGYTGEDGYEISLPAEEAGNWWQKLSQHPEVKPIGLGARDSLRLEAGLCLYGHDIDETTSPVEAGLLWSIGKRRRDNGGFPGFDRIRKEIANGPQRRRVGLQPEGRAPAREGTDIMIDDEKIGTVTSGGFSPSLQQPIAMGYITAEQAKTGTEVNLMVRGKALPTTICKMPFMTKNFKR